MSEPEWADRRLSFGAGAAGYDAWRPGYPQEAVRWVLGDEPREVLDLASGTGRLGAVAAALGHTVVAVEPDGEMRAIAAERLGRALDGTAESIPLGDGTLDAVLVGQAWHWFDHASALAEVARVLRPGGLLGVFWNLRDGDVDWVGELGAIVGGEDQRFDEQSPGEFEFGPGFRAVGRIFRHDQWLDADGLVALADTYSYVRLRPDRAQVLERVRRLAAEHPDLAGRERFAMPYGCVTIRAVSSASA